MAKRAADTEKNKSAGPDMLGVKVFIAFLIVILLLLIPVFARSKDLYLVVLTIALDIGLIASLAANLALLLKNRALQAGPVPDRAPQPAAKPAPLPAKQPVRQPVPSSAVDPKNLPDPGLVFKFSLAGKDVKSKQIVIGRKEGSIKTYSTEILENHLDILLRLREDPDRDIYDTAQQLVQKYSIDLRRSGKVLIHLPGETGFREMGSRERLLIQKERDPEGDANFEHIDAKEPIRLQLGERLRHDGKFVRGYFEFHLFTKPIEIKTGEYTRLDQDFYLRLFRIFPGYDVAHPTDEGLYPMIDPFLSRGTANEGETA